MSIENRYCLECGGPLKGRSDKKFCDDQCRSTFNNKINGDYTSQMRNINNILRRNRRILHQSICGKEMLILAQEQMADAGFNFKYHTHSFVEERGMEYKLCYDYGYVPDDAGKITVFRWTDGSLPQV